MRKIMLLAAMVAMVLAAAAPALAQSVDTGDTAGDDQVNQGDTAVFNAVCQNILGEFAATTGQYGGDVDIDAVGGDDAAVVAEIAQEQNVSVEQVNECLNNFAATATATAPATATATASATAAAAAQYASPTATATATALPPTGGPVPSSSGALALGAGALLVAGGLLARRIVR
ncbi:MAG: hypothetical protein M3N09_03375 [Actinomycetota bacterium]|nr:hypothetical protein [Actinomycetota bacterium]